MVLTLPFPTRSDAGRALSGELQNYKNAKDTLILALVRGGVVIGKALSDELNIPLHPYIVRKLGHPGHREYALGAIAEGGSTFLDDAMMRVQDLDWKNLEPIIDEEMKELRRRKEKYMVKPRPDLKGKTVILTDDGAATGATLFAAIEDLRKTEVKKIIIALPVCPPDTAKLLASKADKTVFVSTPATFYAVGQFYIDFSLVEDEEVIAILNKSM